MPTTSLLTLGIFATDPKDDQAIIDTQKILGFNHVSLVVAEVTETKVGGNTQLDVKAVFWDLIISNAKTMAIDVRTAKKYITKPKSQKLTFAKETKKTDKQITTSGQLNPFHFLQTPLKLFCWFFIFYEFTLMLNFRNSKHV